MDVTKLLRDGAVIGLATGGVLALMEIAREPAELSNQVVTLVLTGGLATWAQLRPQAPASAGVAVLLVEVVVSCGVLAALRWHRAHAIRQHVQEEERRNGLATWAPAAGRRPATP